MRIAVAGGTGLVGAYVMEAARQGSHQAVALSRASGVDLRGDAGVAAALEGVDVIIDATNWASASSARAAAFFTDVTGRLQAVGAAQGVSRLIALSIAGIDRASGYGYYRAKLMQEQAALAGPLPATIVRATQFHEFPAQLLGRTSKGPFALMPRMLVQTVAARTVAQLLVEVAAEPASGQTLEVAGPERGELVELARRIIRRRGRRLLLLPVPVPGAVGRAMRRGALLPSPQARIGGPSFSDWLATPDSLAPAF